MVGSFEVGSNIMVGSKLTFSVLVMVDQLVVVVLTSGSIVVGSGVVGSTFLFRFGSVVCMVVDQVVLATVVESKLSG